ncbi:AAA family ATPase [Paraferrimonas haliotis]|uniref:ATPase dynein-related AAA domain-containing protein n=1 Tax=Paraferrimonas haliotis TaxID=2013866 RepID=A0AA37WXJ3_9GAMM|nr:AAA family ATPase [Paraferrimonas haliotis]GLS84693.1 hypothetical protein GCM10007894_26700 [Paraferrimonas haliotis]
MDLNEQFRIYKSYIEETLKEFPLKPVKINCIKVFKALAELTSELPLNSFDFISREELQLRVNERYPVKANSKRQEVNKYLSQRFNIASSLEPDFIEFTLEDDENVYCREDGIGGGRKRTGYRIRKFSQRADLIRYLCQLDLTEIIQVEEQSSSVSISKETKMTSPLNQILYGPPGTGKTYHTVEAAVKAADPEYFATLDISNDVFTSAKQREQLRQRYQELVEAKRIRFVTFHQSYGYEEFVEGMRAITNDDHQIEYKVQAGIFKQICTDALANTGEQPSILKPEAKIWKLSIDGVKASKVREYCFKNNVACVGWGQTGDMASAEHSAKEIEYIEGLGPLAKSSLMEFTGRIAQGDIVVCVKGMWSIQAIGVVSGDYYYDEGGTAGNQEFRHVLPVDWLAKDFDVNIYELNDNTRLTLKTCYELNRFNSLDLYERLKSEGVYLDKGQSFGERQNYVLVIDEINRGNISKIFGELITLIEPSKRKGKSEWIELMLPQSNKSFSVPENLHIIGTMNTADRSLAMMDTALRRRFDFVEMMPKPQLLEGVKVRHNGHEIDIEALMIALNKRIEILHDREHTLGHAFFMPLRALVDQNMHEEAFAELVTVLKNKVIPLLEEYFFEDWSKIRMVLADNQKTNPEVQFIKENKQSKNDLDGIFGPHHKLDQYGQQVIQYSVAASNEPVWNNVQAYIGIYQTLTNAHVTVES